MSKPEVLQNFEFTIKLQVSGDVLQSWDVKNIMKMLTRQNLFSQFNWKSNIKGFKTKKKHDCAICYDTIEKKQIAFKPSNCVHVYHKKCINEWFEKGPNTFVPTCPMCRTDCNIDFKHVNTYNVHTTYNLVNNNVELERTIQREGSNYVRYDSVT